VVVREGEIVTLHVAGNAAGLSMPSSWPTLRGTTPSLDWRVETRTDTTAVGWCDGWASKHHVVCLRTRISVMDIMLPPYHNLTQHSSMSSHQQTVNNVPKPGVTDSLRWSLSLVNRQSEMVVVW